MTNARMRARLTRRHAILVAAVAWSAAAVLAPAAGPPVSESSRAFAASAGAGAPPAYLDHVSVAVGDLERARRRFESLGFTLKPGRPHPNSIESFHAKFEDGSEIELITAKEPRDSLARDYIALASAGDGGAFVALRSSRLDDVARRYKANGLSGKISRDGGDRWLMQPRGTPLRWLWVQEIARAAIDETRFTGHANGAVRLAAVWVDSSLAAALRPLERAHGLTATPRPWPRGRSSEIELAGGRIYLVGERPAVAGRPILGATVEVRDVAAVESILRSESIRCEHRRDARGTSVLLHPEAAMGMWLEFLQPD